LSLPLFVTLDGTRRSAVVVAVVYFVLYLLSSFASRRAVALSTWQKGEERAASFLWKANAVVFGILALVLIIHQNTLAAFLFMALFVLQNFWEPILLCRIDRTSESALGATVLSIDQQVQSCFTMLMAPLLGFLVDRHGFWPVGVLGLLFSSFFAFRNWHGAKSGTCTRSETSR